MKSLPASPDLSHLKKQAKCLLRDAQAGVTDALRRFVETLPTVRGIEPAALAQRELRLHDAQSVVAREYGFRSWLELKRTVEWKQSARADRLKTWLTSVLEGNARQRGLAVRMLHEEPDVFKGKPWLACATGNEARVRDALAHDPDWVNRNTGPLDMAPLVIVTHSRLIREDEYEAGLLACAALLLRHGANVDATWIDPRFPDSPLSALYGAAGRTHHAGMTKLLLDAGADPNDNESLYHSVESADPGCTLLLIAAGARVVGTNAIGRVLDYDKLDQLQLLLRNGGHAKERPWIHHAILRGRSLAHVQALVDEGADLRAADDKGVNLYRFAQAHGRTDVVGFLRQHGVEEPFSEQDEFIAACTRGDEHGARLIADRMPGIFERLTSEELQTLPQLAAVGDLRAVRTMLALGWPREVKTGWDATALNLAVYQGDAAMARLLLEQSADWRTPHGFGDIALGTLSFASQSEDVEGPAPRNHVGCAQAMIDHGVPLTAFEPYSFSEEVTELLDAVRRKGRIADGGDAATF